MPRRLSTILGNIKASNVRPLDGDDRLHAKALIPLAALGRWFADDGGTGDEREDAARAAAGITFAGCFRLGEIVASQAGDEFRGLQRGQCELAVDRRGRILSLSVRLRVNKTRRPRIVQVGAATPLVWGPDGLEGSPTCGLRVGLDWIRRASGCASAAALDRWLRTEPEDVGRRHVFRGDTWFLDARVVAGSLRRWCAAPEATGHSLRVTAATTLRRQGGSIEEVMNFGGWDSSKSLRAYFRSVQQLLRPLPIDDTITV